VFPGGTACQAINVNMNSLGLTLFAAFGLALYVSNIIVAGKPALIAFSFFPALDIFSDVLYLLQTAFYNKVLFAMAIVFIVAPNVLFLMVMREQGVLKPSFLIQIPAALHRDELLWLSFGGCGRPLYKGRELSGSVLGGLPTSLALPLCLVLQGFSLIAWALTHLLWFSLHLPYWAALLAISCWLFQTKMMSVGRIWTLFFRLWRSKDTYRDKSGKLVGKHDSKCDDDNPVSTGEREREREKRRDGVRP